MKKPSMKGISYFKKYLDIAPFSLALWRSVEAYQLSRVQKKYKSKRPVLDIGCGFGEFAGVFADRMIEVGIDISATDLLKAAKGKKYKNLRVDDARNLSLKDGTFNTVISISVLEHIPQAEKAIEEIYRVLKPGGYFIATIPTNQLYAHLFYPPLLESVGLSWLAKLYYRGLNKAFKHVNLFSPERWERIIIRTGFELLESKPIISRTVTKIFDLFLLTALPSQMSRWLAGDRLVWGLSWKRRLLVNRFGYLIEAEDGTGSNIILVARKPQ